MKYFYYGLNVFLIVAIPLMIFVNKDFNTASVDYGAKVLNSNEFISNVQAREVTQPEVISDNSNGNTSKDVSVESSISLLEESISSNVTSASIITDVLESQVGAMSAYGPDCIGCSGRLGGGFDARSGAYTYSDSTYGNIRIVAGDASYPYGSIVRVKGSKLGEFYAIVLDRGGAIGKGKRFMFDLLFPSSSVASQFGTEYNLTFEILRYGY